MINTPIFQPDSVRDNHLYIVREQIKINLSDLVFVEAEINYSHLYLQNGKKITIAKTLKFIEKILVQHHFFRTHRTFFINQKHLKSYNADLGEVLLTNNFKASVSRRRKNSFEVQINSSIKNKAVSI
jgi:DNA-binding LytR/AlgR family response regulator